MRKISSDEATTRLRFMLAMFWIAILTMGVLPSLAENVSRYIETPSAALPLLLTGAAFSALAIWGIPRIVVDHAAIDANGLVLRRGPRSWTFRYADIYLLRERPLWPSNLPAQHIGKLGELKHGLGPRMISISGRAAGRKVTLRFVPAPAFQIEALVNEVLRGQRGHHSR